MKKKGRNNRGAVKHKNLFNQDQGKLYKVRKRGRLPNLHKEAKSRAISQRN